MVLAAVVLATVASLAGIVAELAAAKAPGAPHAVSHVLLALATVAGAWLLLPTMFALTYASLYDETANGAGLAFPGSAQPPTTSTSSTSRSRSRWRRRPRT